MRRSHISEHDLREEMRLNANIDDPSQIRAAYKERNGRIGIVKQPEKVEVVEVDIHEGVQTIRIEVSRLS
jgi:uncharacterized membrane protein YcaP (DUF421 family)